MILCEAVCAERIALGWGSGETAAWILGPPRSSGESTQLRQTMLTADVAVLGACPQEWISARVRTGRLTLIMSERIFKRPFARWRLADPRALCRLWSIRRVAGLPNSHYLAIGSQAAPDMAMIRAFGERLWSWAYFADVPSHAPPHCAVGPIRMLWVGRMLDWKRVDVFLRAVAMVCRHPGFAGVDLVGTGPKKAEWMRVAHEAHLGDKCTFHEAMPPAKIRDMMRKAAVYVLPSNRQEGWGVAANEAMSEGAVLVANEQAGAAQELIVPGHTGFLFKDGDVAGLATILRALLDNPGLREEIRSAAWQNMQRLWHPRVGAERLIGLCEGLLGLAPMPKYATGPCRRLASDRKR